MMATMIMLGFASQFLKDMLKYEDEENFLGVATRSPYLDTSVLASNNSLPFSVVKSNSASASKT